MTMPKVYDPQQGYKYQILARHPVYNGREWEHCDYAKSYQEAKYLVNEYSLAYGAQWQFKKIYLPKKYHPKGN